MDEGCIAQYILIYDNQGQKLHKMHKILRNDAQNGLQENCSRKYWIYLLQIFFLKKSFHFTSISCWCC